MIFGDGYCDRRVERVLRGLNQSKGQESKSDQRKARRILQVGTHRHIRRDR